MSHTTLKDLRKHDACISGYNRVTCFVTGRPFDEGRETYVRIRHDEPITLATILESNGLDDALWALRACKQTPEMVRAERLFGVWCARQVQHLMTDQRSLSALDVAERHADGLATDSELASARDAAWAAAWDAAWDAQKTKFIEVFCGESINVDCLRTKEVA